ncbi:MAG: aldolase [Methanomicrobiales archaeon]|nr:aldolase [Methanomicrobiales archaeon]MDI6876537.1 aldolase [Methanomicrobiales archaeon]
MRDPEIARIGRRLFAEGLTGGNFGNFSVREGKGFWIKRTGAYMDEPGTAVFVPFSGSPPPEASRESVVHRAIYLRTNRRAVLHVHPPYAVAASMVRDLVEPKDVEGGMICPRIAVIEGRAGSEELAERVADALAAAAVVLVRGHGTFSCGSTLEEAYLVTSAVEHSCRILHILGELRPMEKRTAPGT